MKRDGDYQTPAAADATAALEPSTAAPEPVLARWRRQLREKGVRQVAAGRMRRYSRKVRKFPNWCLGKYVELTGDQVTIRGARFTLDNPLVPTAQKAEIYFGKYETTEIEYLNEFLDASLPTVEFGASIGVVACLTNRKLERPTEHVVVEANPTLVPTLERNRALNNAKFEILNMAVGYGAPSIEFHITGNFLNGSTRAPSWGGRVHVAPTVDLTTILRDRGFDRINLIMDIEGAEVELVAHELDVLRRHVKLLIAEIHPQIMPDGQIEKMLDALAAAGFRTAAATPGAVALINRAFEGDEAG